MPLAYRLIRPFVLLTGFVRPLFVSSVDVKAMFSRLLPDVSRFPDGTPPLSRPVVSFPGRSRLDKPLMPPSPGLRPAGSKTKP